MLTLNYYSHLFLNSKYKFLINLIIILTIYSVFYGNTVGYCMNKNVIPKEIPTVAEVKESIRPSHQIIALKKEIVDFAGVIADLYDTNEKLQKEVNVLGEVIEMQKKMINFPFEERLEYKRQIRSLQNEINILHTELNNFKSA